LRNLLQGLNGDSVKGKFTAVSNTNTPNGNFTLL
jgi:hypothetical protein